MSKRRKRPSKRVRRRRLMLLSALLLTVAAACIAAGLAQNRPASSPETLPVVPGGSLGAGEEAITGKLQNLPPRQLEDGCWYVRVEGTEMLLANRQYALPESFGGEDAEASGALQRMFDAADADGVYLYLVSGYRSYQYQLELHQKYTDQWGAEQADRVSAEAGHSEHQTGLAFDILGSTHEGGLSESFDQTGDFAWLQEHCWEYGFILRYLEGKEQQTGYSYEPWHYRYIGDSELARRIMQSGLSLEEYAGLV